MSHHHLPSSSSVASDEHAAPYPPESSRASSQQTLIGMQIDSVKSAARRAAWKADTKWDAMNPFGRVTTRDSTLSRNVSRSAPTYDEEATTESAQQQPAPADAPTEEAGTNFPSGSPTSSTDVGSQTGSAAEYYRGGNASDATLSGMADSIEKTNSTRKRVNLDNVPENSQVQQEQEKEPRDSDENSEEERKRRHDEMMKRPIPWVQQVKTVLFPRWFTINWLIIAAPVGIGLHFTSVNPLAIFIINFIAIIPLAGILSFATEEIALRVGEVLGGLLNASFG